ncbi:DUF5689 domain-containing protein [Robiginitalea sp.]|uniref:DUF5689 domain-containing protein n=1 Tax=Robiginitalea sp. TaxID=1902411 RepID=UPI003C40BB7A
MKSGFEYLTVLWCFTGLFFGLFSGCQPDLGADPPERDCSGFGAQAITLSELKRIYPGETIQIADSLQWEAIVVSSDATSNIFGEIYLQDAADPQGGGLVFYTDLLESHSQAPFGSRVSVYLQGLYLGVSSGAFELGGSFSSFGNLSVGRLPARLFQNHIRVHCESERLPLPVATEITELSDSLLNTFVEVENVEFITEEAGLPFAEAGMEVRRTLSDCYGNSLNVKNSGYSDFYAQPLPTGHGRVRGLLNKYRNRFELVVMSPSDFDFRAPRCEFLTPSMTSDSVLISEIADPDNLPEARFLELFNASGGEIDLTGWELLRYTNANVEPGRTVSLEGLVIPAAGTLVLSAHPDVFEATYGFIPDKSVSGNGPADSNGDDTLVLIDPFGNVKDTFGNPGTDGSGTPHEFEDGKAERRAGVLTSSPLYNPSQWLVYNDSGGHNSIEEPQNAPEDFSPGNHPSGSDQ